MKICILCGGEAIDKPCAKYCLSCRKIARLQSKRSEYIRHKDKYKENSKKSRIRYIETTPEEIRKAKANENAKRYYQKNKEKILARNKELNRGAQWRKENKQYLSDKRKEYVKENREKVRASRKADYQNNKDRYKLRAKEWEIENKDRVKEIKRQSNARCRIRIEQRNAFREQLKQAGDFSAADWKITLAEFDYSCAYCGKRGGLLTMDHVVSYYKRRSSH